MGLSGNMGYMLQFGNTNRYTPNEKKQLEKEELKPAITPKKESKTSKAEDKKPEEATRYVLLTQNESKETKKAPTIDPTSISKEDIEKAGGLKGYISKAVGVELFKGNYENALAFVSYLNEQETNKETETKDSKKQGQASINTVVEKIAAEDYTGAIADIDKMKAMNDMFARAVFNVQREIQNQ